jgi:Cu+-exporting ATPase
MNVVNTDIEPQNQIAGLPIERIRLKVDGMTCAGCVGRVQRTLNDLEGVTEAAVNLATGQAYADIGTGVLSPTRLAQAVTDAGYNATVLDSDVGYVEPESVSWRERALLLISIALTLPFIFQMTTNWLGSAAMMPHWLQFLLATPVQFVAGWRFYGGAYHALKAKTGNMDQLVALGTSAAYGYSIYLALTASGVHLYVEASATVITLVLLGKWLEERAKRGAAEAIRALVAETPDTANLLVGGQEETVPLSEIQAGDHVAVRPGERIPVDGTVISGESENDESLITGESLLIHKGPDDPVTAGAINVGGHLVVVTNAVGAETVLSRIIRLVDGAQSARAPMQQLVDRVAAVFVPAVIIIGILTFSAWLFFERDMAAALLPAVAVLVIACPCALGLATPAAIMVGTGVAAKHGILIRDPEALERCRDIDVVVLDKTGTLTEGKPQVATIDGDANSVLRLAASALSLSEHPLALAIVREARMRGIDIETVRDFQNQPGRGVVATLDGKALLVGNAQHVGSQMGPDLGTSVYVVYGGDLIGRIELADQVRQTSAAAIGILKSLKIEVIMLSGDNEAAAHNIAGQIGIERVIAGVAPDGKAGIITQLKADGFRVAMVGDGINDAPALAAADVSIAMGSGSDVAMETAGITLMRSDPLMIADAIDISRATARRVRQNLFWAFAYNTVAIPVAAAGFLSPAVAGAAMALSSVSVVGNALLLNFWRPSLSTGEKK